MIVVEVMRVIQVSVAVVDVDVDCVVTEAIRRLLQGVGAIMFPLAALAI